jgi:hypothetical protein
MGKIVLHRNFIFYQVKHDGLHKLYASPNIIRVIKSRRVRWVGKVACMGEMRNAYKIMVRKAEGTRPFRRPRHKWEDTIRIELREIRWEVIDWIHLAQDREK